MFVCVCVCVRARTRSACEFYYINLKKKYNNSHTSSTPIDLYEIPHIFYTRTVHSHCLLTPTGYY